VVWQLLWWLETVRTIFNMNVNSKGEFFQTLDSNAKADLLKSMNAMTRFMNLEHKLFGWTMYALFLTTVSALYDLYFSAWVLRALTPLITKLARWWTGG
jgi:hypothetical protein